MNCLSLISLIFPALGFIILIWLMYRFFKIDIGPRPEKVMLGDRPFETILLPQFGEFIRNSIAPIDKFNLRMLGDFSNDMNCPGRGVIANYANQNNRARAEVWVFQVVGIINYMSADIIRTHSDNLSAPASKIGAIFGTVRGQSNPWGGSMTEYQRYDSMNDPLPYRKMWDTGNGKNGWFFCVRAADPETRKKICDLIYSQIS